MDKELTLIGHLSELRQRILLSLGIIFVLMLFTFSHASDILTILKYPAIGFIDKLVFFSPTEAFSAYFKIAFFSALFLSVPAILYQFWAFISPALEKDTQKQGAAFLVFSILAFVSGVIFGFFLLLPAAIKFLIGFSQGVLIPMISVSSYVSFVTGLLFGCGLVFEMPILSYLLAKAGILNYQLLRKYWKHAVVVIFIVAAIITPSPDAFNMCLMAMPMIILYEISIWVAKFSNRKALFGKNECVKG
ncbi:MAG: twin-arginine translocase subunit TatC [Candidatus Omnitrophica bacterium]|nr:twin-arginine translocase subunit TatC [Candidatus Omnitrophota bacterium]